MAHTTTTKERDITIIPRQMEYVRRPQKPRLLTILLSILALIALFHFIAVAHSAGSGNSGNTFVTPANCKSLIHSTDYTQIVHFHAASQEMEAIQFIDQLVGGQPAALIQVVSTDTQHTLDVYVYSCTMQKKTPQLTTLFSQQRIPQGIVEVSSANTLIISQPDTTISATASTLIEPLQQNIYREYNWLNGKFIQTSYPSLYPVTSRSEAEQLQQQSDTEQFPLWADPLATAEQMAKDIFQWTATSTQDIVISNDGVTAYVLLVQNSPHIEVMVTLTRLVQHDSKGLWFVTAARSKGIGLSLPHPGDTITSPTIFTGAIKAIDEQITAQLFDHTLTPVKRLDSGKLAVQASGTYTNLLYYKYGVPHQQGDLLIQSLPPNGSNEEGQLLLINVLLG